MQLTVHIPRDKEHIFTALAAESQRTGWSEHELILAAIEEYVAPSGMLGYRTYSLGAGTFNRGTLYDDQLQPGDSQEAELASDDNLTRS